ncbi:MAG: LamG-like jellyroll fold domain-containing protein [Thermofilaceae archaeon]
MPLARSRLLPVSRSCLSFNGVNQYAVVGLQPDGSGRPFTVYGWSEITIEEMIYPVWPKANAAWSKFSMIGDFWADYPSTFFGTDNRLDYTWLGIYWVTRRADGTKVDYDTSIYAYRNSWVHVVRRFTSSREYSVWVNGNMVARWTIPSTEYTVLEWNPDTASRPWMYRRFVLGASALLDEHMTARYGYVRIYSRALTDEEILWNFYYPDNPVRNGLVLWLHWDSIDTASNMWYDKSGFGNHARLYNNPVKEDVLLPPKRLLSPTRTLAPVR